MKFSKSYSQTNNVEIQQSQFDMHINSFDSQDFVFLSCPSKHTLHLHVFSFAFSTKTYPHIYTA